MTPPGWLWTGFGSGQALVEGSDGQRYVRTTWSRAVQFMLERVASPEKLKLEYMLPFSRNGRRRASADALPGARVEPVGNHWFTFAKL